MRFWGIEPKTGLIAGLYAFLAFYLNARFEIGLSSPPLGLLLLVPGLALWLLCYLQVSRAHARGELLTTGCYSKVRHPIYSIWGILILPGFSLVIGGLMLLLPLVYWLSVMAFIGEEEKSLEERFGEGWRRYSERTGRFLPLRRS
ncbi:methyltransferase family protein [Thermococcus waiotapuensis]|uniref:Isoprenylcysteine carboxylmethyltransferase family protein n=1 Tax=Thermococcus waiotapuensis TaxID=90909 RepID=A0AAE4NWK4_9EURY|nr:isoprenylcysteine carboxylmethyltransferase family protein [Thermococcus waiotapuensis]MDV3104607.1 isoprenylcysteine carboxylmethyltransferase family protein [Thermococcus waiotapuensis]